MKVKSPSSGLVTSLCSQVKPNHKAQPPSNNKGRQGQIDQPIGLEAHHTIAPKIIKARITKSGNCDKDRVKDSMPPAEARDKAGHEEQGSQPFDGKGGNENRADKTGQALVIAKAKAVSNGLPILVTELLTALHKEETDKGQNPQATDLDQKHTDELAPTIIGRSHRLGKEPRHTDHGDRCKKVVYIACC